MENTPMVAAGYCRCGCGEKTRIADRSAPQIGIVKGQPNNFIFGHAARRSTTDDYKNTGRGKGVHVLTAEKTLGKPLPRGAVVHHINERKGDNSRGNHVICQNQGYHMLLHLRLRALRACGNPSWRKCGICQIWCTPRDMKKYPKVESYYHAACAAARQLQRWREKRSQAAERG